MEAWKPPLRIAMFPLGSVIAIGDSKTIGGPMGAEMQKNDEIFNEFNRSYVWVTDNTITGTFRDNKYTGVLAQFYKNESDVLLVPNDKSPYYDVAVFGEVLSWSTMLMVAPLDVRSYPDQVLTQLFRFSVEVVFLLLLSMYAFARILSKSEGRTSDSGWMRTLGGCWHMIQMLLLQSKVAPVSRAGRILVVMTAIGVLFWLQIWYNQMHSDMVAFDNTRTAMTLEDALSMNKTPAATEIEAATVSLENLARRNPKSTLGRLIAKAVLGKDGSSQGMGDYLKGLTPDSVKKYVGILSRRYLTFMKVVGCVQLRLQKSKDLKKSPSWTEYDFVISSDKIAEFVRGTWNSPYIRRDYAAILRKKLMKLRESGLALYISGEAEKRVHEMALMAFGGGETETHCVYASLDEYLEKKAKHDHEIVTLVNFSDVFEMTAIALMVSASILALEKSGLIAAASLKYRAVIQKRTQTKVKRPTPIQIQVTPAPAREVRSPLVTK